MMELVIMNLNYLIDVTCVVMGIPFCLIEKGTVLNFETDCRTLMYVGRTEIHGLYKLEIH